MRTTDVANAYNLRRKHLSAELEGADKQTRGKITRSILNTDLSGLTYETVIDTSKKIENFDEWKITKTEQKLFEIKQWILNLRDNTAWISEIKNPSRLTNLKLELESIEAERLQQRELLEIFYSTYVNVILVVLEDALIRIYVVDDTKSLSEEIDLMLSNLTKLNPIGGLASILTRLLAISPGQQNIDDKNQDSEFFDIYSHTCFIWSQSAQLISDYINSIETNKSMSLENTNKAVQQRMESLVQRYKTN
jgi:hypothetical protein